MQLTIIQPKPPSCFIWGNQECHSLTFLQWPLDAGFRKRKLSIVSILKSQTLQKFSRLFLNVYSSTFYLWKLWVRGLSNYNLCTVIFKMTIIVYLFLSLFLCRTKDGWRVKRAERADGSAFLGRLLLFLDYAISARSKLMKNLIFAATSSVQ